METIINAYRGNYWLISFHLLFLGGIVYSIVLMGKHPGPAFCVILAVLLNFANFFLGLFLDSDSDLHIVMGHVQSAMWLASSVLLYLAVFGWRSRDQEGYGSHLGARPAGMEKYNLPACVRPARIPVAWVTTVTVLCVLSLAVGLGAGLMAVSGGGEDDLLDALAILGVLGLGVALIDVILTLKILHRAWLVIQDGHARTTPGKAVGYLFIPIYNLYWVFVAWAGLAKDFNAFASRYRLPVRRLSVGLFTLQCVLMLVGIVLNYIPVVGIVSSLVISVVALVLLWNITGAVNDVYASLSGSPTTSEDPDRIDAAPAGPADGAYAPPGYYD